MPRIDGGGRSIPPQAINSSDSIQNAEETKTLNTTEAESNNPSERKTSINTRAVAEHKLAGNLQQMKLNSQFDILPLKGGVKPAEPKEYEAWPIKWMPPDFDNDKNHVRTESLEIAHAGFKSPSGPARNERIEYPNITFYTPEPNDTLQSVAAKFGITVEAFAKANNLDPSIAVLNPRFRYRISQDE